MRNLKKFLALVLAMIMVVSAAAMVSADFTDVPADNRYADAINDLAVKGIVKGTTDTTFGPTQDVLRWQMALFVGRAMTGEVESDANWANGIVPFVDVTEYKGAIEYAYVNGVINGWADPVTGDPVFGPNDGITYVQALKMAVCALGYDEQLEWPWGYYNKAAALGLTANMEVSELDAELNRAETAQIIYNMVYAAPADGGLTLAEKNFSVQTPSNTTLFLVVATPKQYYADYQGGGNYASNSDVGGTWMGIQPLVNGVPTGAVTYLPCEKLGIAAAEVEDYFNRSVELINYDAATGEFSGVILGDAPTVVNYSDISGLKNNAANTKFTYKEVYTTTAALTGASLINEIVIYTGADAVDTAKVLPLDKDGNIINGKGAVVATLLTNTSTGTKYWFNRNLGVAMTEAEALETYGVYVKGEGAQYVKFQTKNAGELYNEAFQLAMYDDDRDGLYERAVYSPIYMGVYHTQLENIGGAEKEADGMLLDIVVPDIAENGYLRAAKDVTYTDKAAQTNGAIVVYTFNPQRNVVNVIDILELQTGTLTKVNATGFRNDSATNTNNTVKLTLDGKVYTLGYDMTALTSDVTKWSIDGAQLGAAMMGNNEKRSHETVHDVAEEAFLEYYYNSKDELKSFVDTYLIGEEYSFYAYNGYILMLDMNEDEIIHNFAVVDEFVDFDFGEIYLDMYVGGDFEEEAKVTVLDGRELAELSNYKFSMIISKQEYFYPGTIYEVEKVDGAYELYDEITANNFTSFGLVDAKVADPEYDATAEDVNAYVGTIQFKNGSTTGADRTKRLRTNSDTVFYFIEPEVVSAEDKEDGISADPMETTVTPYYGSAEDFMIKFNKDTQIWTDSLGTANDRATVVYVINPADHDFFDKDLGAVWVFMNLNSEYTTQTISAEEALGAAADDYGFDEDDQLFMYTGTFFDMDTGAKVPAIYTEERIVKLASYQFLKIDENGVAINPNNKEGVAAGKQAWTAGTGDFTYFKGVRNYALYGIENKNANVDSVTNGGWGNPTEAAKTALNYYDWLYYHKMKMDVVPEYPVPNSILDVEFVNEVMEAELDDECVILTALVDALSAVVNTEICDEDDNVTDITVIDISDGSKVYTGEDAIDYIVRCPQITYCNVDDYLDDGHIVFIVGTKFQDA